MAMGASIVTFEQIGDEYVAAGRPRPDFTGRVEQGSMKGPKTADEEARARQKTGYCPRCDHPVLGPDTIVVGCSCGYGQVYCVKCGENRYQMPGDLCMPCSPALKAPPGSKHYKEPTDDL